MSHPLDPEAPLPPADPPPPAADLERPNPRVPEPSASAGNQDLSGKPYEFNPPPHNANLFVRTDFSTSSSQIVGKADARYRDSGLNPDAASFSDQTRFRLGRITMGNEGFNFAVKGDTRWGFRFMFNPPGWSGGATFNQNIIPQNSKLTLLVPTGLEVINFTITLNRMPDVMSPSVDSADYYPNVSAERIEELRRRGTNYDLEYLYRVANANRMTTIDGQNTADYGILLPGVCYLTLGRQQYRGRLVQIGAVHKKFSPDMVPVHTEVAIGFQRIASMKEETFKQYLEGGGFSTKKADPAAPAAPAAPAGGGGGVGVGGSNAESVWKGLKAQGFTDESAAGVLGNLQQESGVNPASKQGGGGPGRGIMQWTESQRWRSLTAWASSNGNKDPWALDTQFQFMIKEIHDYGIFDQLRAITNIEAAVLLFHNKMEGSADKSMATRNGYAHKMYDTYHGKT